MAKVLLGYGRKVWRERLAHWVRPEGVLPDFIIAGAQKAGTTWLAYILGEQESILKPTIKEINYFDDYYHLGRRWYKSHFTSPGRAGQHGPCLRYEATPDYLFDERVPERIAADIPRAKIVVAMRDPVTRAVSGYYHMVNAGLETRPFGEAIRQEVTFDWRGRTLRPAYVRRGEYAPQIARYQAHFPDEQIHLMIFESLIADPGKALNELSAFLGTPLKLPIDRRIRNRGHYDFDISDEDAAYIRQATDESSEKVFQMMGQPRIW